MPSGKRNKLPKRKMQSQAAWLVLPLNDGGGMTYDELGRALGHSGGWAHHVAHGNWGVIRAEPIHATIINALYLYGRSRVVISREELLVLEDVRNQLGDAIKQLDELARRYDRRAHARSHTNGKVKEHA